ncbi:hypothetical protein HWQ18_10950 [Enterobacter ludwigii]|uniref:hypothetical protein n=1 Tax=Enterobacter ludwigii TaxID=299767 RepID=UPI00159CBA72|nr:hypothetical protein [Enterobacter ludwigii]QLA06965.1 hypothetical protein HWQ18_10950 [Enterobacter ludwigii]
MATAVYFSLASYATVDSARYCCLRITGAAEGLSGALLAGLTVALLSRVLATLRPGSK